jgi:hypothetical protein
MRAFQYNIKRDVVDRRAGVKHQLRMRENQKAAPWSRLFNIESAENVGD